MAKGGGSGPARGEREALLEELSSVLRMEADVARLTREYQRSQQVPLRAKAERAEAEAAKAEFAGRLAVDEARLAELPLLCQPEGPG